MNLRPSALVLTGSSSGGEGKTLLAWGGGAREGAGTPSDRGERGCCTSSLF